MYHIFGIGCNLMTQCRDILLAGIQIQRRQQIAALIFQEDLLGGRCSKTERRKVSEEKIERKQTLVLPTPSGTDGNILPLHTV